MSTLEQYLVKKLNCESKSIFELKDFSGVVKKDFYTYGEEFLNNMLKLFNLKEIEKFKLSFSLKISSKEIEPIIKEYYTKNGFNVKEENGNIIVFNEFETLTILMIIDKRNYTDVIIDVVK